MSDSILKNFSIFERFAIFFVAFVFLGFFLTIIGILIAAISTVFGWWTIPIVILFALFVGCMTWLMPSGGSGPG